MAYTTINDLPERLKEDLLGTEFLLITDPDYSYKTTLNSLNERLLELSAGSYQELTNKIIDSVSNYVHANAIHFSAVAVQNILKGVPVKLVQSAVAGYVYVDIAGANDVAIGVCEADMLAGQVGLVMVAGVLEDYDTSAWTEGDLLYAGNTVLTNIQPSGSKIQFIGYVLDVSTSGKLLISGSDPFPDAEQITYSNTISGLSATTVQGAIDEIEGRVQTIEEAIFQQATAPTAGQGASDGDIWMDTTTNTLNVYREWPTGSGVYRWEPLLYKLDDVVDGGSW